MLLVLLSTLGGAHIWELHRQEAVLRNAVVLACTG
jgi:hypothetical protein